MPDYRPRSDKAEWHLTHRCDLACPNCNRACFLPPQTPDMSVDDGREFCRQAADLDYRPRIMLIGGEPTLHPDFLEFVKLASAFAGSDRVEIWSNGFSAQAKELLALVQDHGLAIVQWGTVKRGNASHPVRDIFIAPADFGETREPCGTHACFADPDCGISVDSGGYTVCCMGGAIDGILGLSVRTRRLADLWDPEFAARQTRALCDHCGQHLGIPPQKRAACQRIHGTLMSPAWARESRRAIEQESKRTGEQENRRNADLPPKPCFACSPDPLLTCSSMEALPPC
ncbi:MAG: radical SAM protein [Thermoguttaceae bacterium]|jgi:hypothetical protein